MENNIDGMFGTPEHNSHPKVHSLMCSKLKMMLDKVTSILPSIEAAQPGCKAGIEELCNLYSIVDKGKLIIQNCIECSSLYLVADVHNDLRNMKFLVDPAEEEAGKAVLKMLRHSDATEELEMHTFLLACSKLNLTSQKAMLIERRAIKKLLDKINGNDPKKEGILSFFLYLVRKYGKNSKPETGAKDGTANETTCTNVISSDTGARRKCIPTVNSGTGRYDDQNNLSGLATPPPELCCPISMKLMHDPVIIASGQTYERENIERWFSKGYDTCPRTQAVIYNWCKEQKLECTYLPEQFHNYSLSSLHDISAPLIAHKNFDYMVEHSGSSVALSGASYLSSPVRETDEPKTSFTQFYSNVNCQLYLSFCNFDKEMFLNLFQELSELPVELQRQAVKDLKTVLNSENEVWQSMISNGFLEAFLEFLKNDNLSSTLQAQKTGIYFFLTFLCNSRTRILSITEDAVRLIVSFLDSELKLEALLILHELLHHPICRESPLMASLVAPSVIGALDTGDNECLQLALKMICELSSSNDVKSLLVSPGIIAKLSTLLSEVSLTEYCLKILRNLCEVKQAADLIIRSEHCIGSISDHLDTGSRSEQEHASVILHTVCSRSTEADRFLVMKEGVIPALVDLSVYGTEGAKASSIKLLQTLGGSGSRSKSMAPNCGKHGGQIVDAILCADIVTSVLAFIVMTNSMARYQKCPSGMIGRGMTGTGGDTITLLEVVHLYEIIMAVEEMAEPM
uniref:RING-type E3 ubiquitin transferase n=1 Tax=Aegilops tauschii TaxID=37682 RepID=M8BQ79_AEGTA